MSFAVIYEDYRYEADVHDHNSDHQNKQMLKSNIPQYI